MFYKLTKLTHLNINLITKGLINKFPRMPKFRDSAPQGTARIMSLFLTMIIRQLTDQRVFRTEPT